MFGTRLQRCAALTAAVVAVAMASPGPAHAAADPGPVAPNQFFTGLVNGAAGVSRIAVTCDGPIDVVPLGHPVAGQTVAARQLLTGAAPVATDGFTGSAARALDVRLGSRPATVPAVTLRFYETAQPIPTTILVPCTGTGTVEFAANPTSRTARASTVEVTFVSQR